MQGEAKALRVPFYFIDRVFPQAFSHVAKVRHAQVDVCYRVIGEGAWHHCQHLQIVHQPARSPAYKREPSAAAMHFVGSLPQIVRIMGTGLCRMLFPVASRNQE